MNVEIVNESNGEGTACFELACGKQAAFVTFPKSGGVWVCCQNAAHRVWRGSGKAFSSVSEALENYRSPEMRTMIEYAAKAAGRLAPEGVRI